MCGLGIALRACRSILFSWSLVSCQREFSYNGNGKSVPLVA